MRSPALALALFALAAAHAPAADDKKEAPKAEPKKGTPNKLAKSSSPYLLQHAYNPVDWYPWGTEAFEKAKKEKKLIFLSIGYSACHWCHVMERESFSNAEIAKIMNGNFVCIKVDREERPDIDEVYMTALQVSGEGGGWPLSMFLTPEGKPIFGATYFPPEDKQVDGEVIPGFKSILKKVIEFDKDRADLEKQADRIAMRTVEALEANSRIPALVPLTRELVSSALDNFEVDPEHGGTGVKARMFRGTKFPRPPVWGFLLKQSQKPDNADLKKKVALTLAKMIEGGIYDQLGGGFHRYSTERTWTVPHFEKMLYDNAQLVELYSEAFAADPRPEYQRAVAETLAFIKREMTSPDGAFYSAIDADSNEKEGEFYVWTPDELKKVLGNDEDVGLFTRVYAVGGPNFEERYHILRLPKSLAEVARDEKLTQAGLLAKLEPLKKKLFDARAKRERPFLDTKIIAAWNGQMIAGYARAGQVFKNKEYLAAAATAADFLLAKMTDKDGRLLRIYAAAPGEKPSAKGTAFLDDYAYVIHGLLGLYDATGEKKWLDAAKKLTDLAVKWHADGQGGGFYFSASDAEKLFARAKDSYDGVQPSGNSQMARNLLRLSVATKDETYRDRGIRTIKTFAMPLRTSPTSMPTLLRALDELLDMAGTEEKPPAKVDPAPKKPKESADTVTAKLVLEDAKDGRRAFALTLTVTEPWHLYANPPGLDSLVESQTEVSVYVAGKKVDAKVEYPKGTDYKDVTGDKYQVYVGTATIKGSFAVTDGAVEVRVKVNSCKDGKCLPPSVMVVK